MEWLNLSVYFVTSRPTSPAMLMLFENRKAAYRYARSGVAVPTRRQAHHGIDNLYEVANPPFRPFLFYCVT